MPADPKPEAIDFELLPRTSKATAIREDAETHKAAFPRLVALLMDDLFRLPGTRLRFGLNPVLDLIPAVGDGAAALFSGLTLFAAIRYRIPKIVIMRMGANVLVNALVGLIPGIGEAFAFWFRPSLRNYHLLKTHLPIVGDLTPTATRKDWFWVIGIVGVLFLLFLFCVILEAYIFLWILHAIFGS